MIERYELPEMASLFTEEAKLGRWLAVELAATDAQAEVGVVPVAAAEACRDRAPVVDTAFAARCLAREEVTDHDVAAFVDVVQESIGGPEAAWIHHGLTSSDVVDTAWCWALRDAADLLLAAADEWVEALVELARAHRDTVTIGRTHGIHAEPTTFGRKAALWALQADRDRRRLRAAREAVAVCKLSGAVGTYSNVDPRVEALVAERLGLAAVPATQVVSRDRHAEYLWACAAVGATVELVATEIRHLQRTEVSEAFEGVRAGQKGSSAMPHKRNPILSERLAGLARVLRGNLLAGLEDVALWHERDISHSSVERVILPDSSALAYYLLRKATSLVRRLEVRPERMLENVGASYGLVFSQPVLLALVASGLGRDEAYRIVQDDARRAWAERVPLRDVLEADERVGLDAAALDACFDLERALRHAGAAVDALDEIG